MVGLRTSDFWRCVGVDEAEHYCTCCERRLDPAKMVWLELNCTTGRYSDPVKTKVPDEESQGCHPFGSACAKKRLKLDAV